MHITNQDQLKKQKRKLSLMFTIILFGVVTGLQIIFLVVRYVDYSHKEFKRLQGDWFPKERMMEMVLSGNVHTPQMPMFWWEGKWWKLKGGNMSLYNPQQNSIIFSSVGDDELTKEIIQSILKENKNQGSITYNDSRFLFVREQLSWGNWWFFFIPALTSITDIVRDSLLFILFFGFCSILFYRVIYWFVGKMFVPIEDNMQDMEQFIFNAGHELKTPLSVIKSHLQLASAKKQYKKPIDESIKEIDKMNILLESLVNLSVIKYDENKESLDITQEVENIIAQYSQIAQKNKTTISLKKEDTYIVSANRGYLNMMIANLLSNAIKYNKKWGKVEITIWSWILEIKDTWIGIPQKEITMIFDRFYQVGNVRNQEGSGIGLSLVKKIIDMYGWKINLTSKENIGTTFIIKFF